MSSAAGAQSPASEEKQFQLGQSAPGQNPSGQQTDAEQRTGTPFILLSRNSYAEQTLLEGRRPGSQAVPHRAARAFKELTLQVVLRLPESRPVPTTPSL